MSWRKHPALEATVGQLRYPTICPSPTTAPAPVSGPRAEGVEHTVAVNAESLYEAVARGLAAFRKPTGSAKSEAARRQLPLWLSNREVEHRVDARFRGVARIERQFAGR